MLNYSPGETGEKFLGSKAFVKIIYGPVGGGKSTVALFELFQRSINQKPFNGIRRTKHIILRNTLQQLKSTVKPLIDQWLVTAVEGKLGAWKVTDNTFEMRFNLSDGTFVHSDFILIAADTPDDVRRLLSLEASDAWVEEAREVDPEIFSGLQGRVARFPNRASGGVTYPGLICSTNPPPMGTWWQQQMSEPPKKWEVFAQPPALLDDGALNPDAENLEHLDPDYYDNLISGKTDDWIDVYLKNKFGAGGFGMPVFKSTFRRKFHVSETELKPIVLTNNPLIVGMDNGLTAAAVIMQQDARGRVNVLDECFVPKDHTMGVERFLDSMLVPMLRNRYPARPENVLFVVDPACFQRSQVNEVTIAQAIQSRGFRVMKAASNDPEKRIGAVEGLLARAVDAGPGLLISSTCGHLAQALDWGYRNKRMANGETIATPEKNHFSHIADAFQYGCMHYNVQFDPAATMFKAHRREVKRVSFDYV